MPAKLGSALIGCALLEVGGTEVADVDELLALRAEAGAERCPASAAAVEPRHRAIVRAAPVDSLPLHSFCRGPENSKQPVRVHVLLAQTTRRAGAPSGAPSR